MDMTIMQTESATAQCLRRDRGFTLLEVMITVVILAAAAMGFFAASIWSLRTDTSSQQDEIVMTEARKKIEEVNSTKFGNIETDFGVVGGVVGLKADFDIPYLTPVVAGGHVGHVTVALLEYNLFEVTVTITWQGVSMPETYSLYGLVSAF